MPDGSANDQNDTGSQPVAGGVATPSVGDAAKEVSENVTTGEPSTSAVVEVVAPGWNEALAYADYLHTDAVLLVLGVWLCAGIMLARILLDRVIR